MTDTTHRDDILNRSLTAKIEAVASGKISSTELTQSYIDRIQSQNPKFNIVIRDDFANAILRAKELDAILAKSGKPVGKLHGIPFSIKDAFRLKHKGTSFGLPGVQLLPGSSDCKIADRLAAAGAILLGQTNVPFSCFDWQTRSPIYGLTKNPLDPNKTVGGSSGGSAASVAAGFSSFEIGSDIAGSIRYPAHCCGVFGLRPTHNLVPFDDIGPSFHSKLFNNVSVAGPLANSIDDLRIPLSVLTHQPVPLARIKKPLSILYSESWGGIRPDEESRKTIAAFIDRLEQQGHSIAQDLPKIDFARATQLWGLIVGYEYKQALPAPFRAQPALGLFNYFFNVRRFRAGALKITFAEGLHASRKKYEAALLEAEGLRAQFDHELRSFDLWITPTSCAAAIPHQKIGSYQQLNGERVAYSDYLGHFLMATAVLHHPILTVPIPTAAGLPIGVQLHGKRRQDWELLEHAELFNEHYFKMRLNL